MREELKIMLVAGEASGDLHGAKLVTALRELSPGTKFVLFGSAGPKMREVGVEPTVAADELSVVGVAEIATALPMFLRTKKTLLTAASTRRPDFAVLIDFPEFNLKLARSLNKLGIKVIYYISPQLWAWRKYRVSAIRRYVDLLLTILPFEKEWYDRHGIQKVEYVGNPLVSEIDLHVDRTSFIASIGLDPDGPLVAFLPGSRAKEIERILPVMVDALAQIGSKLSHAQFVIALADGRRRDFVDAAVSKLPVKVSRKIAIVERRTGDALGAADVAAITSGTATLEAGIIGTPMAIVYRTSLLNYVLIRPLVSVEHYGLINLIAKKRLAAELIQDGFTASALSSELIRLLDPDINRGMRKELKSAVDQLGTGSASGRAAEAILKFADSQAYPNILS